MSSRQLDEEAIFHVARTIGDPAARSSYFDQVCAGDAALRQRVEALLEVHEQDEEFLKSAPVPPTVDQPPVTERPGQQIGRYKLLQQIGEGGFGVVYMAEQERPLRRKVALKIIKPGMDTGAVVARFEAERQALALMDHPNIARVFDGGATESGRPYFVMELVQGVPITEYCDKNHLAARERLELFVQVCQAVQHAHQKGVIHRDLKPTNIMVTLHDGVAVPKVIDFGVSKAINQQLTERTLFTAYGQMIGTPQYMSPEQAEMSGLDVDTRSDVYSLGVLLYELLTGTTPLEAERLRTAGLAEMLRMIRDEEPPRPSTRVSTLGDRSATVAQNRGVDRHRLRKLLRGELDWIVMRALEKERGRRYESASALAADVHAYLHDEAVKACPPSATYRLRKLARRHKTALAAASAVLVTLIVATTVSTFLAVQAMKANGRANRNLNLGMEALNEIFDQMSATWMSEPAEIRGGQVVRFPPNARDAAVLAGLLGFYDRFAQTNQQASRSETALAYRRVGKIHERLGEFEKAEVAYFKSLEVFNELAKAAPDNNGLLREAAVTQNHLGLLFEESNRIRDAEQAFRHVVGHLQKLTTEDPDDVALQFELARSHINLSHLLRPREGSAEAAQHAAQAIDILERLTKGPSNPDCRLALARGYRERAWALHGRREYSNAIVVHGNGIRLLQSLREEFPEVPDYQYQLARSHHILAITLIQFRDFDAATHELKASLDVFRDLLERFPNVPQYRFAATEPHFTLGWLHEAAGDLPEAEKALREGLALSYVLEKEFPDIPRIQSSFGGARMLLAAALLFQGKRQEAVTVQKQAVEHLRKAFEADPGFQTSRYESVTSNWFLGAYQSTLGDSAEAIQSYERALQLLDKLGVNAPSDGEVGNWDLKGALPVVWASLGELYWATSRNQEAHDAYRKAFDAARKMTAQRWRGRNDILKRVLAQFLADCPFAEFRDPPRAIAFAEEALEEAWKGFDLFNRTTLGSAYYRGERYEEAIKILKESIKRHGFNGSDGFLLARAHFQLGERETARQYYNCAVQWMKDPDSWPHAYRWLSDAVVYNAELRRDRAEAAEVLGITDDTNAKQPESVK